MEFRKLWKLVHRSSGIGDKAAISSLQHLGLRKLLRFMDDSDLAVQEIQSLTDRSCHRVSPCISLGYAMAHSVSKLPQGPVMVQLRNLRGVRLLLCKVATAPVGKTMKWTMKAP